MLAERFQLAVHEETEEKSGLALVLKERRPKLSVTSDNNAFPAVAVGVTDDPQRPNYLQGVNVPMSTLAERLAGLLKTSVVDRTGLQGSFDFKIEYVADVRDTDATGPQLASAIQELGLKLKSAKVPVVLLIIDHAEKPSEN